MKKKVKKIIIIILFLTGLSLVLYPIAANQWNVYRQQKLIDNYESTMKKIKSNDFKEEWKAAEAFNKGIVQNTLYGKVFEEQDTNLENTEYWKILNIAGDGVMGYLTIPKIHVELAIYHGTASDVLQEGIGHLGGTKLPIGGESTHSVLAAHRGLPSAKLFTDLDKLEMGDKFYIQVLDKTLAYKIDQILPMVEKDDRETLEKELAIEEGKDQVTLFTCTPYGVNTHRLLVRGTRVAYNGELDKDDSVSGSVAESIQNYYILYLIAGVTVTIAIILFMKRVSKRTEKLKK